jgi:hypothetical protein
VRGQTLVDRIRKERTHARGQISPLESVELGPTKPEPDMPDFTNPNRKAMAVIEAAELPEDSHFGQSADA